jgi:hypothetical protein
MKVLALFISGFSLAFSTSASAQSFDTSRYSQSESRVAIGISVPLGRQQVDRDVRIDLRLDRVRIDASGGRNFEGQGSLRLSRTLDRDPVWLINQRRIVSADTRNGISSLGIAGIVVGAVLVAAAVSLAVDPPLNDLFEPR